VEVEFQHGDRFSARWGLPPAFQRLFDDIYKYRMAADDLCGFDLTVGGDGHFELSEAAKEKMAASRSLGINVPCA